eukprot:Filipodium_phascolosomae@DN1550_c0_g1_i1.p1
MPSTEKNRCLTRFSVSPTYRQSSGAPPAVKKGATPSPIEHHPLTITPDTRLDNLSKRHISLTGRMPGLSPFTATTSCGSAENTANIRSITIATPLMRLDMPQFLASPLDNDPPSPPSCAPSVPALQNVSPPALEHPTAIATFGRVYADSYLVASPDDVGPTCDTDQKETVCTPQVTETPTAQQKAHPHCHIVTAGDWQELHDCDCGCDCGASQQGRLQQSLLLQEQQKELPGFISTNTPPHSSPPASILSRHYGHHDLWESSTTSSSSDNRGPSRIATVRIPQALIDQSSAETHLPQASALAKSKNLVRAECSIIQPPSQDYSVQEESTMSVLRRESLPCTLR